MHTQFGEIPESELDSEFEFDHSAPDPKIQRIVSRRFFLKGTKTLAREDCAVELKPATVGAAVGAL